jgi:hypothetical protein
MRIEGVLFWLFVFGVFLLTLHTRAPRSLAVWAALAPWKGFWRLVRGRRR